MGGPNHNSDILSRQGLNALLFSDPYAKLCYTTMLASQLGGAGKKVAYVDLDTMFTAYFKANLLRVDSGIDIYLPSGGKFLAMLKDVIEAVPASSLVVVDSINSFYAMYRLSPDDTASMRGNLNHLLSVFLMLLVRHGKDAGVPVLATSMLRYRKDGGWIQSPASRRLLQQKSAVRMNVERAGPDLALKIIEHPSIAAGTTILYENKCAITLA